MLESRYKTQAREVINRNIVISLAIEKGFNAFIPVFDSGIDFILYSEGEISSTRKVQLKGRWTIDRKYIKRDIWIAFPVDGNWYLIPHDVMISYETDEALQSSSWVNGGVYNRARPSKSQLERCEEYRFKQIETVAETAARESTADDGIIETSPVTPAV